ncbi:class I SAM-dependent methyltransferase [Companilactobacillus sp.]|uniref:class I SAM-dependent methyltransferase n=1 Tax=Companilactobacillus sp. TaxID=2767905 RepID=UPI00261A5C51|nr:class I SAM-dependent methyltransferase [Companilactobacillus sp.]
MDDYTKFNSKIIDQWVNEGWEWGMPISHEEYLQAQKGEFKMVLTPLKQIPKDWFPDPIKGKKILGLASGGGQQMPILTALGGECTVFDYSQKQLDAEKMVAEREHYQIEIIKGDMIKKLPFTDNTFDMIIQPVANSYIENVQHVWNESYRILKPGGRLLVGLDNGINYIFDKTETKLYHPLPYNPLKNPEVNDDFPIEEEGIQFSHTLDEQIRGQIKAGFQIVDLYEDTNSEGKLKDYNIPTFWATYAIKK